MAEFQVYDLANRPRFLLIRARIFLNSAENSAIIGILITLLVYSRHKIRHSAYNSAKGLSLLQAMIIITEQQHTIIKKKREPETENASSANTTNVELISSSSPVLPSCKTSGDWVVQESHENRYILPFRPPNTRHHTMSQGNHSTSTVRKGPRSQCDQVVFEALAKAAEIVVASRCWLGTTPGGRGSRGGGSGSGSGNLGRFNLLVPEVPSVRYVSVFIGCCCCCYCYFVWRTEGNDKRERYPLLGIISHNNSYVLFVPFFLKLLVYYIIVE